METYFSVSLRGKFVFRTDAFTNGIEAARAGRALLDAFGPLDGYGIVRYDRAGGWTTDTIKHEREKAGIA